MLDLSQPHPLSSIVASVSAKTPLGSAMRTAEWAQMPAGLRDASFFSASVESERWLAHAQKGIQAIIARARTANAKGETYWQQDRARLTAELRRLGEELGIQRPGGRGEEGKIRENDLTDPLAIARLKLIINHQLETAYGKADWLTGMDPDLLEAFPAQELVRISPRAVPRDWLARWKAAADTLGWEGVSRDAFKEGRMIALKTSQIWKLISRFGNPYSPFDFNSGMGLEDVDRSEAEALGIIGPDDVLTPNVAAHEEELKASLRGFQKEHVQRLQQRLAKLPVEVKEQELVLKVAPVKPAPAKVDPVTPGKDKAARVTAADLTKAADAFTKEFGCQVQFKAPKGDRKWGAVMPKAAARDHLSTVGAEWRRMKEVFPTMQASPLHTFLCVASKRGRAHVDGPGPALSSKAESTLWTPAAWANIRNWERLKGRDWGTERPGSQVEDNFRHELGHTLSTPEALQAFRRDVLKPQGLEWFRQHVSEYAHTKETEALAELFCICTRADYVRGTYPPHVEAFIFKTLLGEAA